MNEQEKFNRVSIINIKNKLNLHEIYSVGNLIYVRCPICSSRNGAMILNTLNNSYYCKVCESRGYAIGLYARCNYITNQNAYRRLINEESDMTFSGNQVLTNNKKNIDEVDAVYREFLKLLNLTNNHKNYLVNLGFSEERIKTINFKTIPTKVDYKLKICKILIEKGFELKGIPGFYQDKHFRWTFQSHNGFFIPIVNNGRIVALRIHLDKVYNTQTTDIWFSSSKKYNGTMANNNIMILIPKEKQLEIINDNSKKDIMIVSEMLLAYKVREKYKDKIIIAVPNVISKNQYNSFGFLNNINKIFLFMDFHSALCNAESLYSAIDNIFKYNELVVNFVLNDLKLNDNLFSENTTIYDSKNTLNAA